jgi:hypothetical protein
MSDAPAKVPVLRLILGWGFVGIPLVWGIYQTVIKAAALFQK